MRTLIPVLLAGLLGSIVVPAQASGELESSYQLYRLSGFRAQYAPALSAIGRVGSATEACQQRLAQRVVERFDTVAIQAIADLPDADRAHLIEWFESDLGRAEAAANAQLARAYPDTSDIDMQRLQVLERLLENSALAESIAALPSSAALMSSQTSESDRMQTDAQPVGEARQAELQRLRAKRQSLIAEAANRYRHVGTSDLQLIAQRSSEASHLAFKQAIYRAASDVLDVTLRDISSGTLRCSE